MLPPKAATVSTKALRGGLLQGLQTRLQPCHKPAFSAWTRCAKRAAPFAACKARATRRWTSRSRIRAAVSPWLLPSASAHAPRQKSWPSLGTSQTLAGHHHPVACAAKTHPSPAPGPSHRPSLNATGGKTSRAPLPTTGLGRLSGRSLLRAQPPPPPGNPAPAPPDPWSAHAGDQAPRPGPTETKPPPHIVASALRSPEPCAPSDANTESHEGTDPSARIWVAALETRPSCCTAPRNPHPINLCAEYAALSHHPPAQHPIPPLPHADKHGAHPAARAAAASAAQPTPPPQAASVVRNAVPAAKRTRPRGLAEASRFTSR